MAKIGRLAAVLMCLFSARGYPGGEASPMRRAFENPPDDARIMVRWWWFGPAVTKPRLEREMKAMKAAGIGGFEVQPTYPLAQDGEIPGLKNLKFMSPEFFDMLKFTAAKAKALGLRMDLTLGSGWPYGGPMFTRDEAACALRASAPVAVSADQTAVALPESAGRPGEEPGAVVAALLGPVNDAPADDSSYIPLDIRGREAVLPPERRGASRVTFFTLGPPALTHVKRAAFGAEGLIIDHYSPAAVGRFIREIAEPAIAACGPNPPYAVFCDSLEISGANWTPDFLAEFRNRRGYDLTPRLPALFEDMGPKSAEIRHDWGETVTDLFNERFVAAFKKLADAHDSRFRIQGYGTPPAALSSYAHCDLPEGEGHEWNAFSASRWAASAGHLLGKPVISSETFTWLHSPVFRATPLDLKAEANRHFLCGVNQIIAHGWPYTAEGADDPGWSFYAAGAFNDRNPWWIVMPDVAKYLQRVSWILRQGTPANEVALFLPTDDAWANLGRIFSLNAAMQNRLTPVVRALTDAGYNPDFFDDRLLAMRGRAEDGSFAFGDVRYRVVVLPAVERIRPATMRALEEFARGGGILAAVKRLPDRAPGYLASDAETRYIRDAAERLFLDEGAPGIFVENVADLGQAIARHRAPVAATSPACPEIGIVRRRAGDEEIFFVANTGNTSRTVKAVFSVGELNAEIWDPMTGKVSPAAAAERAAGGTSVALDLPPYGSTIVVLTKRSLPKGAAAPVSAPMIPGPVDLSADWMVRFGEDAAAVRMKSLASWTEVEGRRHFSGVAVYEKTIAIGRNWLKPGLSISLAFGDPKVPADGDVKEGMGFRAVLETPVREAAIVTVNGRRAGSLWCPPYELDVTDLMKPGENTIRVDVANLAVNAMAGHKLPNYDYEGVTKAFGNRFQPQNLNLVRPLPSGLLGPIRLVAAPTK